MTLAAQYKDVLSRKLGTQCVVYDYATDFADFWEDGETQPAPKIIETASNSTLKALIIVWGGMPEVKLDSSKQLAPHLTPLDWVLVFSIKVLREADTAKNANFSIHIIDLTGNNHNEWAMRMRHQLLAEMPWVTLYAPLIPKTTGNGTAVYRAGYLPILEGKCALLSQDNGAWQLNHTGKTLADSFHSGLGEQLSELAKQWAASLTQRLDHHDLNNEIGAHVLQNMIGGSPQTFSQSWLNAMLKRLAWSGGSLDRLKTSYEPPRVPPKTRARVLAIDDQLQNRWDKVLLWLLGVTEGKEIGLSVQKFTRMAEESNGLNVYGALSAEPLIGRLKQAPFNTRDYNFCYLNESNDTPIPELIVLDLRLNSAITSGNLQKQRDDILALVKLAQEKKIPSCQSLAWVGISDKELSIITAWCEGKNSSDLAEAQSLTLLPRLLALATPLTPIILFSSTARGDIKVLLNPYRSIFTAFEKPRVLSQPESINANLICFREQFEKSFAFTDIRRTLIWLYDQSKIIRNRQHSVQATACKALQGIERIELFYDEAGDFNDCNNQSLVGAFCLFHKKSGDAKGLNTALIREATRAEKNRSFAPVWIKFYESQACDRLLKFSSIAWNVRCGTIKKWIEAYLAPLIKSHTVDNGIRFFIKKHKGLENVPGDMHSVMHEDKYWDRLVRMHLESVLYGVLPWIVSSQKKIEVAVFFDQRSIPVTSGVEIIARKWGLKTRSNRLLTVDQNSTWPLIRETILRWQGSMAQSKLMLTFVSGCAVGLGGDSAYVYNSHTEAGPRMIHWLADWVASAQGNLGNQKANEIFAKIMPNALSCTFSDDAEKMLEAARLVSHLSYAEGLSLAACTSLAQTQINNLGSIIDFLAATISEGMEQARGEDLHRAAMALRAFKERNNRKMSFTADKVDTRQPKVVTPISDESNDRSNDSYFHICCGEPFEILQIKGSRDCSQGQQWYFLQNDETGREALIPKLEIGVNAPSTVEGHFIKGKPTGSYVDGFDVFGFDSWVGVNTADEVDMLLPPCDEESEAISIQSPLPENGNAEVQVTNNQTLTDRVDQNEESGERLSVALMPVPIHAHIRAIRFNRDPRGWVVEDEAGVQYLLRKTCATQSFALNERVNILPRNDFCVVLDRATRLADPADS